ncbi:hypothetical protein ACFX13_045679 [Malus domestica]
MQRIKNAKATAMTTVHAANAASTCKFGRWQWLRPRLLLLAFLGFLGLGALAQSSARGVQLSGHGTSFGQLLTGSSSSSSGQSSSFPLVKVVRQVGALTMVGEAGVAVGRVGAGAEVGRMGVSGAEVGRMGVAWAELGRMGVSGAEVGRVGVAGAELGRMGVSGAEVGRVGVAGAEVGRMGVSAAEVGRMGVAWAELGRMGVSGAEVGRVGVAGAELGRMGVSAAEVGRMGVAWAELGRMGVSGAVGTVGVAGAALVTVGVAGAAVEGGKPINHTDANEKRRMRVLVWAYMFLGERIIERYFDSDRKEMKLISFGGAVYIVNGSIDSKEVRPLRRHRHPKG